MAQNTRQESIKIMPEHCGGDLRGGAGFRAACDAFLRRKEMEMYGRRVTGIGMANTVRTDALEGLARKKKRGG